MTLFKLLKLEWLKFKSNAVIKLILSFFFILTPLLIFVGKRIFNNLPPPLPSNNVFYQFDTVWSYQGFIGSYLTFFFLGYFAIYIITSEVSNRTMRQNVITGLTRNQYFVGKLITILFISILATVMYSISCIIIGIFHTDRWDIELLLTTHYAPLRYFLMSMGYMSFGLLIGFVVRRGGLSIFIYFSYVLIIEHILKWFVSLNIVRKIDLIPNKIINYWPMNSIEDLMPNPILQLPGNMMKNNDIDFDFFLTSNESMISSAIYITLFVGGAYLAFMKKDI